MGSLPSATAAVSELLPGYNMKRFPLPMGPLTDKLGIRVVLLGQATVKGVRRCKTRGVLLEILSNLPLEEEDTPETSYAAAESLTATGGMLLSQSEQSKGCG